MILHIVSSGVALSPSTAIALIEHRKRQDELRISLDYLPISNDDLVFYHYDGKPLPPNTITHAWIRIIRKCELLGIGLHDARYTHASLLLKQDVHPKIVQERLGHGSIQITLDTYSHIVPSMQQAAAVKFDDLLLPNKA